MSADEKFVTKKKRISSEYQRFQSQEKKKKDENSRFLLPA